jgi:glyoxylate/hydroxypyruvate reductase A
MKLMHIHIQEFPDSPFHPITRTQFAETAAQAGMALEGHKVTFGHAVPDYQEHAASIEILIATPAAIKQLDLFAAPKLRLVQTPNAGVDALHPFDMIPGHVMLLNNRGVHADRAGEFAIMAMLMLATHMPHFATDQRAHRWERRQSGIVAGRRATIIGIGSLGGGAARRARQFGIHVTGIRAGSGAHPDCDRTLSVPALDEALLETDFLLLACPLTPQTRNLMDARRLALLPPHAGVINIGRGALIDQSALCTALSNGTLAGAVLDVVAQEPPPPDDPVWDTPNLIMTPHISSDDPVHYNAATLAIFFENLRAIEAGRVPATLVDRVKGY